MLKGVVRIHISISHICTAHTSLFMHTSWVQHLANGPLVGLLQNQADRAYSKRGFFIKTSCAIVVVRNRMKSLHIIFITLTSVLFVYMCRQILGMAKS